MGVKDLWQLLAPIGRRVSIETLEGKILAIDMSIWLTQFVKAMRDEDGKMIKNAHLTGTLRRVLKLLYHKIRPVFVFDGETPALKARTIQLRRKVHERHESNRRAAVHRLILNQLKQQLQEQLLKANSKPEKGGNDNNQGSNYAPGFNPVPSSSSSSKVQKEDESEVEVVKPFIDSVKQEQDLDALEWEEVKSVKRKRLDEEEDSSEEDEDEPSWDLPDNHNELNIEVLSSLPSEMRKRIVEDARRKERVKSRSTFIPVADNPDLYSQTQLANFLHTSKLNRRFEEVQKLIDGSKEGKSIAAEGHKKYLYVQNAKDISSLLSKKSVFGSSSSSSSIQQEISTNGGFVVDGNDNHAEKYAEEPQSEDEFTARDWTSTVAASSSSSKNRNQVESLPKEEEEIYDTDDAYDLHGPSSSSSSKPAVVVKRQRLRKGKAITNDRNEVGAEEQKIIDLNEDELLAKSESLKQVRWETIMERKSVDEDDAWMQELEEEDAIVKSIINLETLPEVVEEVDLTKEDDSIVIKKPSFSSVEVVSLEFDVPIKEDKSFYQNFHCDDDEEDNLDDIEWEEDNVEDKLIETAENIVFAPESVDVRKELENIPDIKERSEVVDLVPNQVVENFDRHVKTIEENSDRFAEIKANEIMAELEYGEEFMQLMNDHSGIPHGASSSSSNSAALDRAVVTASNMADWAGRAVRRALRDHLKPKDSSVTNTPSLKSDIKSSIVSSSSNHFEEEQMKGTFSSSSSNHMQNYNPRWEPQSKLDLDEDDDHDQQGKASAIAPGLLAPYNDTYDDDPKAKRSMQSSSRDADKVTEEMKEEVLHLIQAFNFPFIIAPYEAEAQCAVLEQLGLVDGVITEDSDAFLFGAQAVYKNIFSDKKYVEVYLAEDAKREMGLTREDLISLAFFLGSDYTEGVNGVGIVNAMEIIHAFPMKEETGGIISGLHKFKEWLRGYDFASDILTELDLKKKAIESWKESKEGKKVASKGKKTTSKKDKPESDEEEDEVMGDKIREDEIKALLGSDDPDDEDENSEEVNLSAQESRLIAFDRKHKNGRSKWTVPDNFPDPKVIEAYLEPQTNRSTQPFPWLTPSRSKIRDFCKQYLDWTDTQMELQVDPVLQKYEERTTQTRIDSHFMTYHDDNRFAKIASERLRNTVIQITGKSTDKPLSTSSVSRKRATPNSPAKRKKKQTTENKS